MYIVSIQSRGEIKYGFGIEGNPSIYSLILPLFQGGGGGGNQYIPILSGGGLSRGKSSM